LDLLDRKDAILDRAEARADAALRELARRRKALAQEAEKAVEQQRADYWRRREQEVKDGGDRRLKNYDVVP
jgi:hypothetical protein